MFSCWNTHTVIKWDTMRQRKKTCYNRWRDMNKKMMKHILEYVVQIHIQFNIVSQSNKCFEQKYWLLDGINIMTLFKNDTKRKPLLDEMNVFPISVSLCMFVWGFFFLFAFESWLTDRDPFISQSKHFGNISYTCFKSLAAFGLWNWQSAGEEWKYRINCERLCRKDNWCNVEMWKCLCECVSVWPLLQCCTHHNPKSN